MDWSKPLSLMLLRMRRRPSLPRELEPADLGTAFGLDLSMTPPEVPPAPSEKAAKTAALPRRPNMRRS
jgi:hypothetical protein